MCLLVEYIPYDHCVVYFELDILIWWYQMVCHGISDVHWASIAGTSSIKCVIDDDAMNCDGGGGGNELFQSTVWLDFNYRRLKRITRRELIWYMDKEK
jgi:hypothetical protein